MRFFSSCSRTTASCRDLVQIAYQWASGVTRGLGVSGSEFKVLGSDSSSGFGVQGSEFRTLARLDALDADIVRLFQVGVLPIDDRFRPELFEVLLEFPLAFLVEHA